MSHWVYVLLPLFGKAEAAESGSRMSGLLGRKMLNATMEALKSSPTFPEWWTLAMTKQMEVSLSGA